VRHFSNTPESSLILHVTPIPEEQGFGFELHEIPKIAKNMQLNPHYSFFSALHSLHPGIDPRCFNLNRSRQDKKGSFH
jgi:hypothetical protein